MRDDRLDPTAARGLYRDRENGWIFGVCAGVADWIDVPVSVVRTVAAATLLLFFWVTVLVYAAGSLLLREKPLTWSGRCHEYEFWRRCKDDDRWSHS